MTSHVLDVAIVGGGVAGLYAGWSLLTRGAGTQTVRVFEGSQRTGGRLRTMVPPHAPHLRCELGGMRYIDTQALVVDLIEELGLASRLFPVGDEHDLFYLRGERWDLAALRADPSVVPYELSGDERGKTPAELLGRVIRGFLPEGATLSTEKKHGLEETMTWGGRPVTEVSSITVLRDLLSETAATYAMDGMGYTCVLDEDISAVNLLHTDLKAGTQRTLIDGMETLPTTLGARFTAAGGAIETGRTVTRVGREGENLALTFADGSTVTARHVILALPQRALQKLDPTGLPFATNQVRHDLDSVVAVPAAKLYLAYDAPWWEEIGIVTGRSVTDLPIRQCLYFGVEEEADGGEQGNRTAILTASYTDGDATRWWEQHLDGGERFPGPPGLEEATRAPRTMVDAVTDQLSRLHGTAVPEPEWAAFIDWNAEPFGGGWHYWRTGHRSVDVVPRLRKPVADANLYICGEAFSSHQAWILGALSSAERVLQDHLGLPAPDWLSPDADLGA